MDMHDCAGELLAVGRTVKVALISSYPDTKTRDG